MNSKFLNPVKEKLQAEALNAFDDHFYKCVNTRGIISACCGYGKTYLIYKTIKHCIEKNDHFFIIATSRIKLLNQVNDELDNFFRNDGLNPLIKKLGDSSYITAEELPDLIKNNKITIFVTTYNSSKKIVDSLINYNIRNENVEINPDLTILDEAHNTTGEKEKYHQILIKQYDDFFSNKYLFVTATPLKLMHKNKKSQINNDETIFSMNNKSIYGNIFYEYTFSQGFKDNILTPCSIVYFNGKQYADIPSEIKKDIMNKTKNEKTAVYFREIAKFMLDSMNKFKFKKIIVYLSDRTKVELLKNILQDLESEYCENFNLLYQISSITSNDSILNRKKEEEKFKRYNGHSILLSVGIYNEGIDIPIIDCVLFAEERNSETTIVQNIGRCLRIDPNNNNKHSYILIPNILYELDEDNKISYSSKFKVIRKCIKIIKNDCKEHFYDKYTKNFKKQDFVDIGYSSDDESNEQEISKQKLKCNDFFSEINNEDLKNINILDPNTLLINHHGNIANQELNDVKNLYVIKMNIKNLRNYGISIRNNNDNKNLFLHEEYKKDWISWSDFFNDTTYNYNESKDCIKELKKTFDIKNCLELHNVIDNIIKNELLNENEYNNLQDNMIKKIISIPTYPKSYYESSDEWISEKDFLCLSDNIECPKNISSLKNDKFIAKNADKNLSNFLNNDGKKINKSIRNKWQDVDINVPDDIKSYIQSSLLIDPILRPRIRLNKDGNYNQSQVWINIFDKNDISRIVAILYNDECKIMFDPNLLDKRHMFDKSDYFVNRNKTDFCKLGIAEKIKKFTNVIIENSKII